MDSFSHHLSHGLGEGKPIHFSGMGYRERRDGMYWMVPPNKSQLVKLSFIYNHDPVVVTVDGESVDVPANTLFVWDLAHRVDYGTPEASWTVSWLQVWGPAVQATLRRHDVPICQPIPFAGDHRFRRWLEMVRDEFDSGSSPSDEILLHMVEGLVLECRRQLYAHGSDPIPEKFRSVKRMIEGRYREPMTLSELAQQACMSQAHFSRSFKKHYGVSPIDYLIQVRVHSAATLLQNAQTSVQAAALAVGYEDVFHFSKLFKKHMGIAPLHYRDSGHLG